MRLLFNELKKIIFTPAVAGFVLLALIVNAVIVFAGGGDYPPPGAESGASALTDYYEDYDAAEIIAGRYIARHGLTGTHAANVRAKYERLQAVIDEKAASGDGLSPYFGEATRPLHRLLFRALFGAMTAETALLALFAALLSAGYENWRNTEGLVYTSRTGRGIQRVKLGAALAAAAFFFLLIAGVTLALFFIRGDWSAVWDSNVSSLFNSSVSEYWKPLITWRSFEVLPYLAACLSVAAALTVCFCLLGFAAGVFIRGGHVSATAALALCALMFVAEPIAPVGGVLCGALNLTPVQLWVNVGDWFTDGGADIIWANFESWGLLASLAGLAAVGAGALAVFQRKDLG
ncbi:MAG: hypothetical protein LBK56_03325 [Gracilibacteraceae bacterium]|jgi:hypothetical protein|nr:hypothetical protein [Gracilibacteraceae bacterium]